MQNLFCSAPYSATFALVEAMMKEMGFRIDSREPKQGVLKTSKRYHALALPWERHLVSLLFSNQTAGAEGPIVVQVSTTNWLPGASDPLHAIPKIEAAVTQGIVAVVEKAFPGKISQQAPDSAASGIPSMALPEAALATENRSPASGPVAPPQMALDGQTDVGPIATESGKKSNSASSKTALIGIIAAIAGLALVIVLTTGNSTHPKRAYYCIGILSWAQSAAALGKAEHYQQRELLDVASNAGKVFRATAKDLTAVDLSDADERVRRWAALFGTTGGGAWNGRKISGTDLAEIDSCFSEFK
ncbi:MAG: hypothetical protein EPO55_05530 [Reyranella sp.]|uniref:hypothetical protein n=1 Tax=Reyranella sp. TaxID=1929291 RepID=UPI0012129430|nr:hypothetical protein [Reyranella sp.]TAJ41395.1 MAG: hypothetical protein EPO55_05530 [Reyranella sp.]